MLSKFFSTKHALVTACLIFATVTANAQPTVEIKTNMGSMIVELNAEKAPKTVSNFLQYVKSGFYSGTIFHRIISNFMIQGGGYTSDYQEKPTNPPIQNEADNGLTNSVGTIAMARTNDPHSASSQFFINVNDNAFLNHTDKSERGWGYTVFGKVVKGMDVAQRISKLPTNGGDEPIQSVRIESITLIETASKK